MRSVRATTFCCGAILWAIGAGLVGDAAVGRAADAPAGPTMRPGLVCLRIQLGLKDQQNTAWDGSLSVSPGRVVKTEIWRKGPADTTDGNSWKLGTRPAPRFLGSAQKGAVVPVSENGIIVTLEGVSEHSQCKPIVRSGLPAILSDLGRRLDPDADCLAVLV